MKTMHKITPFYCQLLLKRKRVLINKDKTTKKRDIQKYESLSL